MRVCGQMQEELARERRKLTLWGAPGATLRHFAINAGASTARGAAVAAAHPATLFLALPLLALYVSLKYTGAPPLRTLLAPPGRVCAAPPPPPPPWAVHAQKATLVHRASCAGGKGGGGALSHPATSLAVYLLEPQVLGPAMPMDPYRPNQPALPKRVRPGRRCDRRSPALLHAASDATRRPFDRQHSSALSHAKTGRKTGGSRDRRSSRAAQSTSNETCGSS